jgi:peptidoglycan/xylan/chitin deacetylase (PgdA/CDA1 family)
MTLFAVLKQTAVLMLALALLPVMGANVFATDTFSWPEGRRAAVNLAYDDALHTQLDNAIPALNEYGFKGTFYLTLASEAARIRLDEWRAAAAQGHELGNHTLFHPCQGSKAGREWVKPWNDMDAMTIEELREEVILANTMLYAIDGQRARTYTAPCADHLAGGEPYLAAVADLFVAMKTRLGDVVPDMLALDLHSVPVAFPYDISGAELIAIVERAAEQGTMANFTFHGIGGDHLSVSVEAHQQLLQHLADNPDIYWVDTFVNIMSYVRQQQEKWGQREIWGQSKGTE